MVNPGHPSRGCYACRRKKVKCDETRPQCQRCTRVGKACPGYRDSSDSSFHFVNAAKTLISLQEDQRLNHPRVDCTQIRSTALIELQNGHFPASRESSTVSDDTQELALVLIQRATKSPSNPSAKPSPSPTLQTLSSPWDELAIPLFINLFASSSSSSHGQSILSFLPNLIRQSSPDSALLLAVHAAADANASGKLTDHKAIYQARRKHLLALDAVQRALQDPQSASQDDTLCSLFILTLFEYISGDTVSSHGSHIGGYEALLDLRCRAGDPRTQDYSLFLSILTQILIKYLRMQTVPRPRTVQIIDALYGNDAGTLSVKLKLRVTQFNHHAENNLRVAQSLLQEADISTLVTLVHVGEMLDDDINDWPSGSIDESKYAYSKSDLGLSGWSGPFHIYHNLAVANEWNMLRSARLMLLMSLVKCCLGLIGMNRSESEALALLQRCKIKIAETLDDTVASFPYSLGRGDMKHAMPTAGIATSGFALLWPTGLILRCPFSTPAHKAVAAEVLEYIGGGLGLQRALDLKEAWLRGNVTTTRMRSQP